MPFGRGGDTHGRHVGGQATPTPLDPHGDTRICSIPLLEFSPASAPIWRAAQLLAVSTLADQHVRASQRHARGYSACIIGQAADGKASLIFFNDETASSSPSPLATSRQGGQRERERWSFHPLQGETFLPFSLGAPLKHGDGIFARWPK